VEVQGVVAPVLECEIFGTVVPELFVGHEDVHSSVAFTIAIVFNMPECRVWFYG